MENRVKRGITVLGIQQKFYQMSSRTIFLLLDVQQIFIPSKRCLVGSYFSATRCLVENFYQMSSTKSSTRRLVEQKIWASISMHIMIISLLFHYQSTVQCKTFFQNKKDGDGKFFLSRIMQVLLGTIHQVLDYCGLSY